MLRELRGARTAMVALVALGLLLTACSGSDSESSGSIGDGGAAAPDVGGGQAADDRAAEEPMDDGEQGGALDQPLTVGAPLGRKVIHRASLTIEVDDPAAVVDRITTLAEQAGGFVAGTDLQRYGEDDELRGTMTLRVPTGRLSNTLQELKDLAVRVPDQQLDTEDVTEEHADITAQLRNLRALETELVALLADIRERTSSADEILVIFERIRQVRDEIERLEGRQQVLDDLVALATIQVSIQPTPAAVAVSGEGWRPGDTLAAALRTTVGALQALADGAIWVAVTILPIGVIVLLPVVALVYGLRRWRRPAPPASST